MESIFEKQQEAVATARNIRKLFAFIGKLSKVHKYIYLLDVMQYMLGVVVR